MRCDNCLCRSPTFQQEKIMSATGMRVFRGFAWICGALIVTAAQAATTINFEGIGTPMTNSPGSAVPSGAQLGNQYQATLGPVFTSGSAFVALVNLGGGTTSPTTGIGGTSAGNLSYGTPFEIEFFLPGTSTPAATDSVSLQLDTLPLGSGTVTMQAFNLSGTQLGTITVTDIGPPPSAPLALNIPGIHRVVVSETSATVAFDDLTFNPLTEATVAMVPTLSDYALLALIPLVALVAAMPRRRTRT
jgi:hypothetical protein